MQTTALTFIMKRGSNEQPTLVEGIKVKLQKKNIALADRYIVHVVNMKLCAKVTQLVTDMCKRTNIIIQTCW